MSIKCPHCQTELEVLTTVDLQIARLSTPCKWYDSSTTEYCNKPAIFEVQIGIHIPMQMCKEHAKDMMHHTDFVGMSKL